MLQSKLFWPSEADCYRINQTIFETTMIPFGIASYNPNERISDFVGREEELNYFKEQINLIFNKTISRAVRLEGPAGVGKSTLFNYLKESIELERKSNEPKTQFILRNNDIFSTYFQIPGRILEFSDIWKPMLEGLRAEFDQETGFDISLPEYVVFTIIYQMFLHDNESISKIIWNEQDRPKKLYQIGLRNIIEPLSYRGKKAVKALQEYYTEKKLDIRQWFKADINGTIYEISRSDNKKILELFRAIDEDDEYLDLILRANNVFFKSNDEIILYFNDLLRYYACATKKQPLILIGIDEVAKADPQCQEEYFHNLGNLFVKLRNSLNYTLFVFISTTDDWANYDTVLKNRTDLEGQINEFMHKLSLKQLKVEEVIQVFKKRMDGFWKNYESRQPAIAPYYPFSENLFEYVFRHNKRDLRKAIHFLKDLWILFKFQRKIPKLETIFECMRIVRSFSNEKLDIDNLKKFEWNIIKNSFNEPSRFNTNSARSSVIEEGLKNAWKCLSNENPPTITRVEKNPTIITSSGNRKPDIYIELHGNLGAEYRRKIEFQVKAYGPNSMVDIDHIKSSIELFEENFTDFIYFIITGKGLDPNSEAKVKELESKYTNRIRRPVLTPHQENVLFLLALYEEITGSKLGDNPQNDIITAKKIISTIIGQDLNNFLLEIKNLSYRESKTAAEFPSSSEEQAEISSDSQKQGKITDFAGPSPPEVDWLKEQISLKPYKYEICALFLYLKDRETGKYKFKFTIPTVEKNIISRDANLNKNNFKNLVKHLEIKGFLINEKTSYKLTQSGEDLYNKVKANRFQC